MPKKLICIIPLALVLCLIPSLTMANVKVSLKLQGSWAYLQAGDMNAGTQAFFDWGKVYYGHSVPGLIQGGYTALHWSYEFGGDLIFELNRNIGIGIGVGYLQMSRNARQVPMSIANDPQQPTGFNELFIAGTKLSAIPIRVGLFLSLPVSRKIDFTANAGFSYYLQAKYASGWGVATFPDGSSGYGPSLWLSTTAEKKSAAIGLHGGLGIEYNLVHLVAFFVEAQGQCAKFRGFEGTTTSEEGLFPAFSETGKLYFESVPMLPGAPRLIMVQSVPPSGPGGQPREAAVDFSGVSLQAGVRIHF